MEALTSEKAENFLRKALPYFFSLVAICTFISAYIIYADCSNWATADWLINYQGGFVRRGFVGELIYQLAIFSKVSPGFYVFVIHCMCYGLFFYYSYASLKAQPAIIPYAFLIFSPFLFNFQTNECGGGFRKEILFFAVLSFLVYCIVKKSSKQLNLAFYTVLAVYPLLILSHEMLALFMPYVVSSYLLVNKLTKAIFVKIGLFIIPSVVAFAFTVIYKGSSVHTIQILDSLAPLQECDLSGGAISALAYDASEEIQIVVCKIEESNLFKFALMLALFVVAFIPIREKINKVFQNKPAKLMIIAAILLSIPLFVVAIDWGRFVIIHAVAIFLISLIPLKAIESSKSISKNYLIHPVVIIFFMLYISTWKIPTCCGPASSFSFKTRNMTIINLFQRPIQFGLSVFYPNIEKPKGC